MLTWGADAHHGFEIRRYCGKILDLSELFVDRARHEELFFGRPCEPRERADGLLGIRAEGPEDVWIREYAGIEHEAIHAILRGDPIPLIVPTEVASGNAQWPGVPSVRIFVMATWL
jgi:hypothetical protein